MTLTPEDDRLEGLRTRAVRVIRQETGLHEKFAVKIADEIVRGFCEEFGGERIYFPERDSALCAKVVAQFDGTNRDELMRTFGISKTTFYRFLRNMKRAAK